MGCQTVRFRKHSGGFCEGHHRLSYWLDILLPLLVRVQSNNKPVILLKPKRPKFIRNLTTTWNFITMTAMKVSTVRYYKVFDIFFINCVDDKKLNYSSSHRTIYTTHEHTQTFHRLYQVRLLCKRILDNKVHNS